MDPQKTFEIVDKININRFMMKKCYFYHNHNIYQTVNILKQMLIPDEQDRIASYNLSLIT
jgi:hypothetical protein